MNPRDILALMRQNPYEAFRSCCFRLEVPAEIYRSRTKKIPFISPLEGAKEDNMFQITLRDDENGMDYFFPYENAPKNVGFISVPVNCPDGTLVFTSGMNGCAMQVNQTQDQQNYIFMHDKDAESMNTPEKARTVLADINSVYPGALNSLADPVCRIEPDDYMGNGESMNSLDVKVKEFACYLITVKICGHWEVYESVVGRDVDRKMKSVYSKIKRKDGQIAGQTGAVAIF